jgi:hypothetical protein
MYRSIPLLIERKKALVDWRPALNLSKTWPASPNKAAMAACLEMLDALNRGDGFRVSECLEWFAWLRTQPFMLNEAGTAEDIYLGGVAYACDVAACVASEVGKALFLSHIQDLARSHVALCLVGLVPWPGKRVVDQNGDGGKQVVLYGVGKPASEMEYVVRPGMRSWVRKGKKVGDPFAFTENLGPSAIVRAALGLSIAKQMRTERAIWKARTKRWKPAQFPPFGLYPDQLAAAHEYRRDLTSVPKARKVAAWILAMELDFRFYRYSDGSCLGAMIDTRNSSTDPRMLDACYAGGETRKTSPEDGIRSTRKPCRSWWETAGLCTQFVDGSGKVMRIPAPPNATPVYIVCCDFDKPFAYVDAGTMGVGFAIPKTPEGQEPPPVVPPKKKPSWIEKAGL